MLTIYLDQFVWVFLSNAGHGRPRSEEDADVYTLARAASERGYVSFPLSSVHYMETQRHFRADVRKRRAVTMRELSRGITLTNPTAVLEEELDLALFKRFGRPEIPRICQKLGLGAAHAFGHEDLVYKIPAEAPLTPAQRHAFEQMAREHLEFSMLANVRRGDVEVEPKFRKNDNRYMEGQQGIVKQLRDQRLSEQEMRLACAGLGLIDIIKPLTYTLIRAGISFDHEFMKLGPDGLTEFLCDLPSRHVDTEFHFQHYRNPEQAFEEGDLGDVSALDVAVPYCDVVVTERRWRHLLTSAGLDRYYHTVVISDLSRLIPILMTASACR